MSRKGFLAIIGLIFLLVLGFTAQGKSPVTISFWAANVDAARNSFYEKTIKDFEKLNPGIRVDYLGIPGSASSHRQKWDAALAGGVDPDVSGNFSPDMIQMGAVEPLDKYFNEWPEKNNINPVLIEGTRQCDPVHRRLYAISWGAQGWMMWVRPDWFKAANLKIPETWDEFFATTPKLTNKSKDMYGLSIRGGAGGVQTLEMLMYSYSGITNFFTNTGKSTINDPKHVEFVEKYLGLFGVCSPEDDLTKNWTQLAATFQAGKAASIVHNLGSAAQISEAFGGDANKFMALPFPKGVKGNLTHIGIPPKGWFMSKNSKHKDEAWKFIAYLSSKEVSSSYCRLSGMIPANQQAVKDSWIENNPSFKTVARFLSDKNTRFTDNPYYLPGYFNIQTKMEPQMQMVMMKRLTAKQFLDEWAKLLEKEKANFDVSLKK